MRIGKSRYGDSLTYNEDALDEASDGIWKKA